jgi:C4-type Zn-finger protein
MRQRPFHPDRVVLAAGPKRLECLIVAKHPRCPHCEQELYCIERLDDSSVPSAGDVLVCQRCGGCSVCTDPSTLAQRPMTDAELAALSPTDRAALDEVQRIVRSRNQ